MKIQIDEDHKKRILINLIVWVMFVLGRLLLQDVIPERIKSYAELIDVKSVLMLAAVGAIVFLIFGVINRRSLDDETIKESAHGMDLAMAEISSVMMNLGGLTLAVGMLESVKNFKVDWKMGVVSIICYLISYALMTPSKNKTPQITTTSTVANTNKTKKTPLQK
jgi:uncharacterized membrane protein